MMRRLNSEFSRRPVVFTGLLIVAIVAAAVLSGQGIGWARWRLFAWRVDHASSAAASGPARTASWSFAFGEKAVSIRVPVDTQELRAAHDVDTRAMFKATGALRANYVRRVVQAQSRSAFVKGLSRQMRLVRRQRGLDDDEYLELMVRAVQALHYDTAERRVRLPIEVVASGFGVCSEKALLLAALMVHEGYQTGMWVFDTQNHVAIGVRSEAAQFRESGYAFIETTRNAYVGEYDVTYLASGPVVRPPQFIRLGGERRYNSGAEVAYILSELTAAKQRQAAHNMVSYIRGQTDERRAVFELLLRSAAEGAAQGPPAIIH